MKASQYSNITLRNTHFIIKYNPRHRINTLINKAIIYTRLCGISKNAPEPVFSLNYLRKNTLIFNQKNVTSYFQKRFISSKENSEFLLYSCYIGL